MKIWEAGKKLSQRKDDQRALDDFPIETAVAATFINSSSKRERNRDTDNEQEEGKDQICRRPAVPLGVLERPVDMRPRAGVVYQHHAGDRQAAEDVERDETIALISHNNPQITQMTQIWKEQNDGVGGCALRSSAIGRLRTR